MSVDWRALTTEDAPAVARAYALAESVDRTGDHHSEQDVRDELEDESIELGRDTLAAVGGDGEVVAFARVHGPAEVRDVARVWADGAVVPAARRLGLGLRLLGWAQERAADRHRERHPGHPGAICLDVHENIPGKEALARAAGYTATRWEHRMSHALRDPPADAPAVPAGVEPVPYAAELDEAVRQAHCEAFAGHWGATPPDEQRWARWYTGMRAFRPELSWLVLDGGEVAAYVLSYFWEADAAATGVREAFVGQLGVRPAWRQRGLGGLLLATALESYRTAGYERAALGVDTENATGALALYERAGFVVRDSSVTWCKPLT